ncbi:MAG: hypothetical protein Q8R38_04900 [Candidatus Omnitrophota bacterium]|nr:hypothetical protein [Candidatus Omnitrophota bacterium]
MKDNILIGIGSNSGKVIGREARQLDEAMGIGRNTSSGSPNEAGIAKRQEVVEALRDTAYKFELAAKEPRKDNFGYAATANKLYQLAAKFENGEITFADLRRETAGIQGHYGGLAYEWFGSGTFDAWDAVNKVVGYSSLRTEDQARVDVASSHIIAGRIEGASQSLHELSISNAVTYWHDKYVTEGKFKVDGMGALRGVDAEKMSAEELTKVVLADTTGGLLKQISADIKTYDAYYGLNGSLAKSWNDFYDGGWINTISYWVASGITFGNLKSIDSMGGIVSYVWKEATAVALLTVGTVLTFTGFGIPLGVWLNAIGVGMLVSMGVATAVSAGTYIYTGLEYGRWRFDSQGFLNSLVVNGLIGGMTGGILALPGAIAGASLTVGRQIVLQIAATGLTGAAIGGGRYLLYDVAFRGQEFSWMRLGTNAAIGAALAIGVKYGLGALGVNIVGMGGVWGTVARVGAVGVLSGAVGAIENKIFEGTSNIGWNTLGNAVAGIGLYGATQFMRWGFKPAVSGKGEPVYALAKGGQSSLLVNGKGVVSTNFRILAEKLFFAPAGASAARIAVQPMIATIEFGLAGGLVKLGFDELRYRTGNLKGADGKPVIQLTFGDRAVSFLTGVAIGLAIAYLGSPRGLTHIASAQGNLMRYGTQKTVVEVAEGGQVGISEKLARTLLGLKTAGTIEVTGAQLLGMHMIEGAVSWLAVAPAFNLFTGVWSWFIGGIKGIFNGHGMNDFSKPIVLRNEITGEAIELSNIFGAAKALISSSITGPAQGFWMGPLIKIFSFEMTPGFNWKSALSSAPGVMSKPLTLVQMAWNNILKVFGKGLDAEEFAVTLWSKRAYAWVATKFGEGIAGFIAWAEGNMYIAGYVTAVNSALDVLAQKSEDGTFRPTGLSSFFVGPSGVLGWFFLFAKANAKYTEKEQTRMRDIVIIKNEAMGVRATSVEIRDFIKELQTDADIARVAATKDSDLGKSGIHAGTITDKMRTVAMELARVKIGESMTLTGARVVNEANPADTIKGGQVVDANSTFVDIDFKVSGLRDAAARKLDKALNPENDLYRAAEIYNELQGGSIRLEIEGKMESVKATPELKALNYKNIVNAADKLLLQTIINTAKDKNEIDIGKVKVAVSEELKNTAISKVLEHGSISDMIRIAIGEIREISIDGIEISVTEKLQKTVKANIEVRILLGDKAIAKIWMAENYKKIEGSGQDIGTQLRDKATLRIELSQKLPRQLLKAIDREIAKEHKEHPELFGIAKYFSRAAKENIALQRYAFILIKDSKQRSASIDLLKTDGHLVAGHIEIVRDPAGIGGYRVNVRAGAPENIIQIAQIIANIINRSLAKREADENARLTKENKTPDWKVKDYQVKAMLDILSSPAELIKMGTGLGKTSVIAPVMSSILISLYKLSENPVLGRVVDITMNRARALSLYAETCSALGAASRPVSLDADGNIKLESAYAKIGDKEVTVLFLDGDLISSFDNLPGRDALRGRLLEEVEKADIVVTDLMSLKSIKMSSDRNEKFSSNLMGLLTDKGWAIYDEAHVLPFVPHLIMGGNEAMLKNLPDGEKIMTSLEAVYNFVDHLYTEWRNKGAEDISQINGYNNTFANFVEYVRKNYMLEQKGGWLELQSKFHQEFLLWADGKSLGLDRVRAEDFTSSSKEEYSIFRAAIKGFEDAFRMKHEVGEGGFGWGYDARVGGERVVPWSENHADTNMYWSAWNIAGARELIGRKYLNKIGDSMYARKALERVRTSGDSIEVTDLDILSQFMARTLMTATPELLNYYRAFQSVERGVFGEAFKNYGVDGINRFLEGEIWAGNIEPLLSTRLGNIDRLYVLEHQADVDRGSIVSAVLKIAAKAGVDIWVQNGNWFQLYKNGEAVRDNRGNLVRYEVDVREGKSFQEIMNGAIKDAEGNIYKGIILLDQSGCTGLNLEKAIYLSPKTEKAFKSIEAAVAEGRLDKDVFKNGVLTRESLNLLTKDPALRESLETYIMYKESGVKWVGIFDRNSPMTIVEQTLGRDRGIGIGKLGEWGYHKKESWVIDSAIDGKPEPMTARKFTDMITESQGTFLKISLVSSLSDNMRTALVNRFRLLSRAASTQQERDTIEKIRTRFQTRSGVDDKLNTSDTIKALPEVKEAVENTLTGILTQFHLALDQYKGELRGDLRQLVNGYLRQDMASFAWDRETNQLMVKLELTGKEDTYNEKLGGMSESAYSRMTPKGIVDDINRSFSDSGIMRETVSTFGASERRESAVRRMQRAIEETAPNSGVTRDAIESAIKAYDANIRTGDRPAAMLGWAGLVLGALYSSLANSTGLNDVDKQSLTQKVSTVEQLVVNLQSGQTPAMLSDALSLAGKNDGMVATLLVAISPSVGLTQANIISNWALAERELQMKGAATEGITITEAIEFATSSNYASGALRMLGTAGQAVPGSRNALNASTRIVNKLNGAILSYQAKQEQYARAQYFGNFLTKAYAYTAMKIAGIRLNSAQRNYQNIVFVQIMKLADKLGISQATAFAIVARVNIVPRQLNVTLNWLSEMRAEIGESLIGNITVDQILVLAKYMTPVNTNAAQIPSGKPEISQEQRVLFGQMNAGQIERRIRNGITTLDDILTPSIRTLVDRRDVAKTMASLTQAEQELIVLAQLGRYAGEKGYIKPNEVAALSRNIAERENKIQELKAQAVETGLIPMGSELSGTDRGSTRRSAELLATMLVAGPSGKTPSRLADSLVAQGKITKDSAAYRVMQKAEAATILMNITGKTSAELAGLGLISADIAKVLQDRAPSAIRGWFTRMSDNLAASWQNTHPIFKVAAPLVLGGAIAAWAPVIGGVAVGIKGAIGIMTLLAMPLLNSYMGKMAEIIKQDSPAGDRSGLRKGMERFGMGTTGVLANPVIIALNIVGILSGSWTPTILAMAVGMAQGLAIKSSINREALRLWDRAMNSGVPELAMENVMAKIMDNQRSGKDTKITEIETVIAPTKTSLAEIFKLLTDEKQAPRMAAIYDVLPGSVKTEVTLGTLQVIAGKYEDVGVAAKMLRVQIIVSANLIKTVEKSQVWDYDIPVNQVDALAAQNGLATADLIMPVAEHVAGAMTRTASERSAGRVYSAEEVRDALTTMISSAVAREDQAATLGALINAVMQSDLKTDIAGAQLALSRLLQDARTAKEGEQPKPITLESVEKIAGEYNAKPSLMREAMFNYAQNFVARSGMPMSMVSQLSFGPEAGAMIGNVYNAYRILQIQLGDGVMDTVKFEEVDAILHAVSNWPALPISGKLTELAKIKTLTREQRGALKEMAAFHKDIFEPLEKGGVVKFDKLVGVDAQKAEELRQEDAIAASIMTGDELDNLNSLEAVAEGYHAIAVETISKQNARTFVKPVEARQKVMQEVIRADNLVQAKALVAKGLVLGYELVRNKLGTRMVIKQAAIPTIFEMLSEPGEYNITKKEVTQKTAELISMLWKERVYFNPLISSSGNILKDIGIIDGRAVVIDFANLAEITSENNSEAVAWLSEFPANFRENIKTISGIGEKISARLSDELRNNIVPVAASVTIEQPVPEPAKYEKTGAEQEISRFGITVNPGTPELLVKVLDNTQVARGLAELGLSKAGVVAQPDGSSMDINGRVVECEWVGNDVFYRLDLSNRADAGDLVHEVAHLVWRNIDKANQERFIGLVEKASGFEKDFRGRVVVDELLREEQFADIVGWIVMGEIDNKIKVPQNIRNFVALQIMAHPVLHAVRKAAEAIPALEEPRGPAAREGGFAQLAVVAGVAVVGLVAGVVAGVISPMALAVMGGVAAVGSLIAILGKIARPQSAAKAVAPISGEDFAKMHGVTIKVVPNEEWDRRADKLVNLGGIDADARVNAATGVMERRATLRYSKNIDEAIAHEVGHVLDKRYNITSQLRQAGSDRAIQEIVVAGFGAFGMKPEEVNVANHRITKLGEGLKGILPEAVAQAIGLRAVNPKSFAAEFPSADKFLVNMPINVETRLLPAGGETRGWLRNLGIGAVKELAPGRAISSPIAPVVGTSAFGTSAVAPMQNVNIIGRSQAMSIDASSVVERFTQQTGVTISATEKQKMAKAIINAKAGTVMAGQTVTVTVGAEVFTVEGSDKGVNLKEAILDKLDVKISAGREDLKVAREAINIMSAVSTEAAITIRTSDGTVEYGTKSEVSFNKNGAVEYFNCNQTIHAQGSYIYIHTHPAEAEDDREFDADRENYAKGYFGNNAVYVIAGSRIVPISIAITDTMPTFGSWVNTHTFSRETAAGISAVLYRENISSTISEMQELGEGLSALLGILRGEKFVKRAAARGVKDIYLRELEKLRADLAAMGPSGTSMSSYAILDKLTRLLKEAGVFQGKLAVVVDARRGAYSYREVADAIESTASADSPINYFVIVQESAKDIITKANVNIIRIPDGEPDIVGKARASIDQLVPNSHIAYALMESDIGSVTSHYRTFASAPEKEINNMSNFLIADKKSAALEGNSRNVAAAALMVELIRFIQRLAAQDKPTAVATEDCSAETVRTLNQIKNTLGGWLRVITKINIGKIINEFLSALNATAKSL